MVLMPVSYMDKGPRLKKEGASMYLHHLEGDGQGDLVPENLTLIARQLSRPITEL